MAIPLFHLLAAVQVVVASFDGMGARQLARMPRIAKLAGQARVGEGVPPFPSTTFNGHVTMATGCWPEHHGVVGNRFLDPVKGLVKNAAHAEFLEREPIWIAAERSGVHAAVWQWPGGDAAWQGVSAFRMEPFAPHASDEAAMEFGERALSDGAGLVMLYLTGIDADSHRHGPDSEAVIERLRQIDALYAPWIERLQAKWPGLRLILTGDHGMAKTGRAINLMTPLEKAGLHPVLVSQGGAAYLYLPEAGRAQAEKLLGGLPGVNVWRRESLPARFHLSGNPRVGDIVAEPPIDAWFPEESGVMGAALNARRSGTHGYDPERPEMAPWLVIFGLGRGALGRVPLWDIAPTVAEWLGIHFARPPDGQPIKPD